jgi:phospholipid transport system substrate-binding protein
MTMRRWIAAVLASCWLAPAAFAAGESARQVVESTIAAVLEVLHEPDLSVEQRRTRIEHIAYARFDFNTMGKLVLARNWKKFDEAQRDRFIAEFKRHLSHSYSVRIARYDQEVVEVTGEREEKRGDVTVLTAIRGGQFDGAEVDYRMRKSKSSNDEFRVIDVIIEGVSLVANFRSQFKDVVSKEGPDGLIARLKAKNDGPEPASSES